MPKVGGYTIWGGGKGFNKVSGYGNPRIVRFELRETPEVKEGSSPKGYVRVIRAQPCRKEGRLGRYVIQLL